jgi:hypothetical protein
VPKHNRSSLEERWVMREVHTIATPEELYQWYNYLEFLCDIIKMRREYKHISLEC